MHDQLGHNLPCPKYSTNSIRSPLNETFRQGRTPKKVPGFCKNGYPPVVRAQINYRQYTHIISSKVVRVLDRRRVNHVRGDSGDDRPQADVVAGRAQRQGGAPHRGRRPRDPAPATPSAPLPLTTSK